MSKVITLSGLPTLNGLGALDKTTAIKYGAATLLGAGASYLALRGRLGAAPAIGLGAGVGLLGCWAFLKYRAA
jgi:hypothetical protein